FADQKNLEIIHEDILEVDVSSFKLQASRYKIVANIPYYITSHFLRQFLTTENQPSMMVLMIQKEVAKRIIAQDKKESILSISVKAYGQPKIIKTVPAKFFSPRPKVDSAIIKIDNISKKFFENIKEEEFFEMVKKGFAHKRKVLRNNLKIPSEALKKCNLPEKARAEELGLENWKRLFIHIRKSQSSDPK
ncbi:ribosomal RNA small subunit methyltransferase A, partial [Patescibacteria group bacterium]